ncbi:U32 family peptidase, partial [Bacillus subtilis]
SVLYYWDTESLQDFYQRASSSQADIIYLGETVCSKRREMKPNDRIDAARQLARSGKQIVLSTLALLQAPSELKEISKLVDNGDFLIEAHDFGVINMLVERKPPFVAGHGLNCYNEPSLNILLRQGMIRWCMP